MLRVDRERLAAVVVVQSLALSDLADLVFVPVALLSVHLARHTEVGRKLDGLVSAKDEFGGEVGVMIVRFIQRGDGEEIVSYTALETWIIELTIEVFVEQRALGEIHHGQRPLLDLARQLLVRFDLHQLL